MEYLIHPLLDEGRIREPKSRSVLRACKFARQPEESGAQFAQGQALPFFRETCPLKSRDQVVGQPNYFPIEGVGRESTSGNLPEHIVLTQLSDAWLHSGAAVVELPHPGRRQRQVGVPGSIRVTFQRSEEHTSELQSLTNLVCRLLLEKKKFNKSRPSQRLLQRRDRLV